MFQLAEYIRKNCWNDIQKTLQITQLNFIIPVRQSMEQLPMQNSMSTV